MKTRLQKADRRRGSILVMAAVVVGSVAFLSLAMLTMTTASSRRVNEERETTSAMYIAEAALSDAVYDLANGGEGKIQHRGSYGQKASYFVTSEDMGSGLTRLTATGSIGRTSTSVELVVRPTSSSFFNWAAFGDEGLTMDSNAMIDSYDSSLGTYAAQEVNGSGSDTYANENGDVGSNQDIELSSNSGVHGDGIPGVTGTVILNGSNTFVTGTTLPAADVIGLPPIVVPAIASGGSMTITGTTTVPSGDHGFDDLTIDGNASVTIVGPARLVIDNFEVQSNSKIIVDPTNGPVEIYVLDDFIISSNTTIASTTLNPADLQINMLSDNVFDPNTNVDIANVEFNSNAMIYGTIYAPNAAIDIDSNFELFGSVVARHVHLDSNSEVHFDENLMTGGGGSAAGYETICWRLLGNP